MIRYYLCPIIGTGTEDDSYRASLQDVAGITGLSASIPNRSSADGRPKYRRCLVFVDAPLAVHAVIEALPGVLHLASDVADGTEATPEELIAKLRARAFASLTPARKTALRLLAQQLADRADGMGSDGDGLPEIGSLEEWVDALLRRMEHDQARLRNLYVRS